MTTDPRPIIKSRWLDAMQLFEATPSGVFTPHYDRLIQYGLTHGWIDPDTGLLYTDETDPMMKEAA